MRDNLIFRQTQKAETMILHRKQNTLIFPSPRLERKRGRPGDRETENEERETENRQTDRDVDIIACDLFSAPTQPHVHL